MDSNELTKIYVCSPYRAITSADAENNVRAAGQYCRFVIECVPGALPIAPHVYFTQFMDDDEPDERARALELGKRLLTECKEIWVFGERVSDGMAAEITEAGRLKIPIKWFTEQCRQRAAAEPQEVNDKKNITVECYFDASSARHIQQHLSEETAGVFDE